MEPNNTLTELLHRAKAGELQALEELFKRQIPKLRVWARGRIRPQDRGPISTNDIVQDAVLRFLRVVRTFEAEGDGPINAYLQKIVRNLVNDTYRSSEPSDREQFDSELFPVSGGVERELIVGEQYQSYLDALEGIAAIDRFVVVCRLQLEIPFAEIAATAGLTPDAARMRCKRAMERLATAMAEKGKGQ